MYDQHVIDWIVHSVHGGTMQYLHPAYRDSNNCTVRAISTALGLHLITAYELMKSQGRKHGRGTMPYITRDAYMYIAKRYGFQCIDLDYFEARADYGKTITTAQRSLSKHERVVFSVRGHVIGFSKRCTDDWANNRRHHILGAYQFKKAA
jgi:hypothetical protein